MMIGVLRAHLTLIRDGDWREAVLASWLYELSRWRCHLLGHRLGAPQDSCEDVGYAMHVATWQECVRPNCGHAVEVWSAYGPARGGMG